MSAFFRRCIGLVVKVVAWCTRPGQLQRSTQERRWLAAELKGLRLYDYRGCPRSLALRHELHRLSLDIEYCDIQRCQVHQDNLLAQLGRLHAPCLRIEDSQGVRWLDDPEQIIAYLRQRFDPTTAQPGNSARLDTSLG